MAGLTYNLITQDLSDIILCVVKNYNAIQTYVLIDIMRKLYCQ